MSGSRTCWRPANGSRPLPTSAESASTRTGWCRWRQIVALRNRVAHGYFDIDLDIVWNVAAVELSPLTDRLRSIVGGSD